MTRTQPHLFLLVWFAVTCATVSAAEQQDTSLGQGSETLYLHTEFFPYDAPAHSDHLSHRLLRENVRQAFLIAAEKEVGATVLDGTLHDPVPTDDGVVHLKVIERTYPDGRLDVQLFATDRDGQPTAEKPMWMKTYSIDLDPARIYADVVAQLEADSRGPIAAALREAGLKGRHHAPGDHELAKAEELLLNVDVVSQFAAVRLAERTVAGSESPEWLSILVRGYANLGMLTHHQWNSASDVFTSRAWLYAQRLVTTADDVEFALWNRAYAWAIGGTFQNALEDLDAIRNRFGKETEPNSAEWTWCQLVEPYCQCDREATKRVGAISAPLKPWATQLWFELTSAYRFSPMMDKSMEDVIAQCPAAYGNYADLALFGESLSVTRIAASLAPDAFNRHLVETMQAVPELPEEVQQMLQDGGSGGDEEPEMVDPNPRDPFGTTPILIAQKLRETSEDHAGMSLTALGYLLEEEQFVQTANYLRVATNATERSLAPLVDGLLPLIKKHRYAPYIDSYRYNTRLEQDSIKQVLKRLHFEDPRQIMSRMFRRSWYVLRGRCYIGSEANRIARRNLTFPGLIENTFAVNLHSVPSDEHLGPIAAREMMAVAPSSEIAVRLQAQTAANPTAEQLGAWEKQLKEDADGFRYVAQQYQKLGDLPAAARCLTHSLKIEPTREGSIELAELYRSQGEVTKWEHTLLDFLQTPETGLSHALVRQQLAMGFAEQGDWLKAKPHAIAAAQTWSAWGLILASQVCEGLAEWDESEQWIRQAAQNYPSRCAYEWYFWCRRTGRGDREAAHTVAKKHFSAPVELPHPQWFIDLGTYHLLEGDNEAAFEAFEKSLLAQPSFTISFIAAMLAEDLEAPETADGILKWTKSVLDHLKKKRPGDQASFEVGVEILKFMETDEPAEESGKHLEDLLATVPPEVRSPYAYCVAKRLARLGREEEAVKIWRRVLAIPTGQTHMATLSADELRNRGKTRPDEDVFGEEERWPSQLVVHP